MKFHFFTTIAFLLLVGCSVGDQRLTTEQEVFIHNEEVFIHNEIEGAFNELKKAAETLDHERYLSFFDESSFPVLNADGTTLSTFEAFKKSYLPQLEHIERYNYLEFDRVNINVIDTHNAILVNEYPSKAKAYLTDG